MPKNADQLLARARERFTAGDWFGTLYLVDELLETETGFADAHQLRGVALALLGRIPVHMAYSVALMDRHGKTAMVFVAPDRKMEIVDRKVTTNHQHKVEWPRHAKVALTVAQPG